MKITVDSNKCIGCGACVASYPDLMEMDGDKAKAIKEETDDSSVNELPSACPVQAISLE
jgi:ferredoxin